MKGTTHKTDSGWIIKNKTSYRAEDFMHYPGLISWEENSISRFPSISCSTKETHCFIGKQCGYTVITDEEFKRLVLKEKTNFVLPEFWHVLVTDENKQALSDWLFGAPVPYYKLESNLHIVGICRQNSLNPKGYNLKDNLKGTNYNFGEEITFEQFKKYVLKQNIMENKKLVGYKLKDEFKQIEKAATSIAECGTGGLFYIFEHGCNFMINSNSWDRINKAGVLDIWFEPVYVEEKKLPKINNYEGKIEGDYVVYGSNCAKFHKNFFLQLSQFKQTNSSSQNRTIKSVTLSSGVTIQMEDVYKVADFLNENKS